MRQSLIFAILMAVACGNDSGESDDSQSAAATGVVTTSGGPSAEGPPPVAPNGPVAANTPVGNGGVAPPGMVAPPSTSVEETPGAGSTTTEANGGSGPGSPVTPPAVGFAGTGGEQSGTAGENGGPFPALGGSGGANQSSAGAGGVPGAGGNTTSVAGTGGQATDEPTPGRSAGCGQPSTLSFEQVPGESGQAVGFGEGGYVRIGNRGFAVRLPDDYDSEQPYPLIFGFHWNGGNSKEVDTGGSNGYEMAHFGLQKLSNNGAIFVAPDGLNAGWGNSGGQDLQFVDDMVELIQENYCVDTTRIFANGFSYGGGMSYAIACARANVFRAVAIYNGAVLSGCEGGNDPIAYWQMAGQTDNVCTIGAGREMRDRFVQNNGCTDQDPPEPPQPPPYLRPGGHECTTYSGCTSGHPVRWCAHQSGHGNAIVDGTDDLFHSCATPPQSCSDSCPCSWVPEDVWSFFNSL